VIEEGTHNVRAVGSLDVGQENGAMTNPADDLAGSIPDAVL
jgi:hypothetical protein